MADKVTIKIPRDLHHRLCHMVEGTGFSSVTELVVFVLRALASREGLEGEGRLTAEEVR